MMLALAAALLIGLLGAIPASAATTEDCLAQIDTLRAMVTAAPVGTSTDGVPDGFTNLKDRTSLDGKLAQAQSKLAIGKYADAIVKLEDFSSRVSQLLAAGKINPDLAASLLLGADEAVACVQSITSGA